MSWGAIFAGAAGAAALSLILLILDTGLGLSSVSPFNGEGASASTFGWSSVLWLALVQLAASGIGGFLAGRLRTRWVPLHGDEAYFRDTANGFLAWAVATLVTAATLTSVIGSITDAIAPNGLADAIDRGKRYRDAGADAFYFEGPTSERELEKLAEGCTGVPLATSILERGGKTLFLSPKRFAEMGYQTLLYPATLIFQIARTTRLALERLKSGEPMLKATSVDMDQFEDIVDLPRWKAIEERFAESRD